MKEKNKQTKGFWWVAIISLALICLGRWLPHPPNFTPIVGASLLAGALWKDKWVGMSIPLIGLFISDLVINNVIYSAYYSGPVVFGEHFIYSAVAIASIVLIGGWLYQKKGSSIHIASFAVGSSVIFFLISNFGVWLSQPALYGTNFSGLLAAYTAGLPFLWNGMMGDLVYTGIFFGGYHLLQNAGLFKSAFAQD